MDSQARISIHCPQCRGEIDFLEEAQVIRCSFCGSSLLVTGREGVLRYVIPPRLHEPRAAQAEARECLRRSGKGIPREVNPALSFLPFWRMKGMIYRWVFGKRPMNVEFSDGSPPPLERGKTLLTRVLDHTVRAYLGPEEGPATLGVRSQALVLEPLRPEHLAEEATLLPLQVSLERIREQAEDFSKLFLASEELTPEVILHRLVGRSFSVVYFPVWRVDCEYGGRRETVWIDGVKGGTASVTGDDPRSREDAVGRPGLEPLRFSELRFIPFRCPNCGWDFPFRPFSVLHFCSTCRRLWYEDRGELKQAGYSVVLPPEGTSLKDLLWAPFWRCRAFLESPEETLASMADLYRLAPPPRAVNREKESRRPIFFYFPALRFHSPMISYNLASRLTFLQPEIVSGSFPEGSVPVTAGASLPRRDVQELGPIILGSLIPSGSRQALAWLKTGQVRLEEPQVLYFPFSKADLFYREIRTGISFQCNAPTDDL